LALDEYEAVVLAVLEGAHLVEQPVRAAAEIGVGEGAAVLSCPAVAGCSPSTRWRG
jgi:hypothetical protein